MVSRLITTAAAGVFVGVLTTVVITKLAEPTPEPIPEPIPEPTPSIPDTVFDVDGVGCWFENYPVLSYRVADQAVDVMITCNIDIIDHYLPAIERTQ
jgi:hypothetical protein